MKAIARAILVCTILISAATVTESSAAEKPSYASLAGKAERFYNHEEWASAGALYTLMIEARPSSAPLYGRAIVAASMRERPQEEMALFRNAIAHHVAFDSVFASVEHESFAIGQSNLYEHFLENVRESEPWLKRTVNGYLLKYYTYRRNAEGMIKYSEMLLEGAPGNEQFLYALAQGYLLKGDYDRAMTTYSEILKKNPKSYDALLYLGNYYASQSASGKSAAPDSKKLALEYLGQAYSIKPTPYVDRLIKELS